MQRASNKQAKGHSLAAGLLLGLTALSALAVACSQGAGAFEDTFSGARDAGPSGLGDAADRDTGTRVQDAAIDAAEDAGPTPGADASVPPLPSPVNTWSYSGIPGMVCGNGSATGIMVNRAARADAPVFVLLMGGGACWDNATCMNGTAAYIDKDSSEQAMRDAIAGLPAVFDRTRADNAFSDMHMVFVPYCTGDLHGGDSRKTYRWLADTLTIEHRGARNISLLLPYVASTFPQQRVILAGGSAGGYGTMLNYDKVRAAYPRARIDILNDSGPPIQPTGSIWGDMQSAWNMTFPAACTGCDQDPRNLLPYLSTRMGSDRFALLSYTQDKTIRAFTGNLIAQLFERDLLALRGRLAAQQKMYIVDGEAHVIIKQNPMPTSASNWLRQFVTGDPTWTTVGP
jgi:hypothetical protein